MTPDYSSEPSPERTRRSARAWLVLVIAWMIGLLAWTVYIAAYVYVIFRVLT